MAIDWNRLLAFREQLHADPPTWKAGCDWGMKTLSSNQKNYLSASFSPIGQLQVECYHREFLNGVFKGTPWT